MPKITVARYLGNPKKKRPRKAVKKTRRRSSRCFVVELVAVTRSAIKLSFLAGGRLTDDRRKATRYKSEAEGKHAAEAALKGVARSYRGAAIVPA